MTQKFAKKSPWITSLWLTRGLLSFFFAVLLSSCFSADKDKGAGKSSRENPSQADDTDLDDSSELDDDSDDVTDDDATGDDTGGEHRSVNLGLVHFHYYGNLGGIDGPVFQSDQAWAAASIELGIIGYGDPGMTAAWDEIRADHRRGKWLKWRLAQIFSTNIAEGDCGSPTIGGRAEFFDAEQQEFDEFLSTNTQYGDGESCFLHARHDGTVRARWHVMDCDADLEQRGLEGTAETEMDSRIVTLIWNDFGWLFDISSDCARDFIAWRTLHDIQAGGYDGAGFDNIGSMMEDGFYVPEEIDFVDVIEIPDSSETNYAVLNDWYYANLESFLEGITTAVTVSSPGAAVIFNGASYCSWDAGVQRLKNISVPGLGVWCENALPYPIWGPSSGPDRLVALIDLSNELAAEGGFVSLETFYGGGSENPTEPEILFYLAVYYLMKNPGDVLAIKPDWNPYLSLEETCWFDIFSMDIGDPAGPAEQSPPSVFRRSFTRSDGLESLVLVHTNGGDNPATVHLEGGWCRVGADKMLEPVSGDIDIFIGDGWILLKNGSNGINC
jgi:hypothetical protein